MAVAEFICFLLAVVLYLYMSVGDRAWEWPHVNNELGEIKSQMKVQR